MNRWNATERGAGGEASASRNAATDVNVGVDVSVLSASTQAPPLVAAVVATPPATCIELEALALFVLFV